MYPNKKTGLDRIDSNTQNYMRKDTQTEA